MYLYNLFYPIVRMEEESDVKKKGEETLEMMNDNECELAE